MKATIPNVTDEFNDVGSTETVSKLDPNVETYHGTQALKNKTKGSFPSTDSMPKNYDDCSKTELKECPVQFFQFDKSLSCPESNDVTFEKNAKAVRSVKSERIVLMKLWMKSLKLLFKGIIKLFAYIEFGKKLSTC